MSTSPVCPAAVSAAPLAHPAPAAAADGGAAPPPATGWHPTRLLWVLCAWLVTVGNLPLWLALGQLPELSAARLGLLVPLLSGILGTALAALLGLLVWPRWLKPVGLVLLLTVTSSSYFMLSYGVVIDPTMVANTLQTDAREVRDLLSLNMLGALLVGVVLPGVWWWRQPVRRVPGLRLAWQQSALSLLAVLLSAGLFWLAFQDLASLMRNHKPLRYMINPFNTLYALGRASVGQAAQAQTPLQPLGLDAQAATASGPDAAPLIVLVVGETARAANFGLQGYERDTTPRLRALQAQGDLVYFSNVSSCGTNTQTSVPCMFSHLGRTDFSDNRDRHENVLDVLQRAGLAVLWLDNQSGCKGVCERVPNASTRSLDVPDWCHDGECHDEIMLHGLNARLAELPAERRAKGTVVVLHQMGSHGPAYYLRTPAAHKAFTPECASNTLQNCDPAALRNSYDNTIRYTDHFLAQTVAWLQQQHQPGALLYVSDHGESLGENGLYLHGMPYAMAPSEQTHVPMLTWLSPAFQQQRGVTADCLRPQAGQALSHDHLFHSLLGLSGVQTQVRQPALDIFGACQNRAP
ncbi:phosphoethanolamine transferase [Macromonas bipunctata]|uniref:phosphoethanolamine transferase n=1 Tax=Macromonas bipunctata TaxID=183670 RepID=UPI001F0BA427|nr:phosphoethanolamine--lipid A transferase [Macromonas bipunctata]